MDESGTLRRLRAIRDEVVGPTLGAHQGRLVKKTGDGLLVKFGSVVSALQCAAEIRAGWIKRDLTLNGLSGQDTSVPADALRSDTPRILRPPNRRKLPCYWFGGLNARRPYLREPAPVSQETKLQRVPLCTGRARCIMNDGNISASPWPRAIRLAVPSP
jgi:hypothetical protein